MKLQKSILVFACITLLALTGCEGEAERKANYLEKGKAYMEEENFEKARIEFKNVLQIDPKYAEAYFLLGQVNEKEQEWRKAFSSYSKAVELDPENLDARAKLGEIYIASNVLDQAAEQMEAILKKDPNHTEGQVLKILLLDRQGENAKAIQEAEAMVKKDPVQAKVIMLLSTLYAKAGDVSKSINALEQAIEVDTSNLMARILLARNYMSLNDIDNAEKYLKEIIAIEPDNYAHKVNLASFYLKTKQPDQAEKILREAIKQDPEDEIRYLKLSDFLASENRLDDAENELIAAISAHPGANKLRFALATFYERHKKDTMLEKAEQQYRLIIDQSGIEPDGLTARTALAFLLVTQSKQSEADILIEEVLQENPRDNNALLLKGRLALGSGNAIEAVNSLRMVMKDQPDSLEVAKLLSDAHMLNNEPQLAQDVLKRVADARPGDSDANMALGRRFLQQGKAEEAMQYIDRVLKDTPEHIDALQIKMSILAAQGKQAELEHVIGVLKKANPELPLPYQQQGKIYMVQKRYPEAIAEYEMAMKKAGRPLPYLAMIVKAFLENNEGMKSIDYLKGLLDKGSVDKPIVLELLGEVYLAKKDLDNAEKVLRDAMAIKQDWDLLYSTLAKVYLANKDINKAKNTYEEGIGVMPDSMRLRSEYASILERTGELDKAMVEYEAMLKVNPENLLAANNLAALLVDHKSDQQSLIRARELSQRFEDSKQPAFMDTLAWVYYKLGENEKAMALLEQVIKSAPDVPHFQYHLGMVYHKNGEHEEAKALLTKALSSKLNFPGRDDAVSTLAKIE